MQKLSEKFIQHSTAKTVSRVLFECAARINKLFEVASGAGPLDPSGFETVLG